MEKKVRQIKVKVNNQNLKPKKNEDYKVVQEVAASIDKSNNNESQKDFNSSSNHLEPPEIKVLNRPYLSKRSIFDRIPKLRHFLVAGISAIVVGLILGFIMLQLLAGISKDDNPQTIPTTGDKGEKTTENASEDVKEGVPTNSEIGSFSFDGFQQHVVQIGVFKSEEAAIEWSGPYKQENMKPFVWEQDNQFYLFVGIASNKESADQLEAEIKGLVEQDAFDKKWEVLPQSKQIAETEGNWITEGMKLWDEATKQFTEQAMISDGVKGKLSEWLKKEPSSLSESGGEFRDKMKSLTEVEVVNSTKWDIQFLLLSVFNQYKIYLEI